MLRVQHVDTKRDLLQQWLGLATVVFHTAAGANEIPALTVDEAAQVRDRIAELARTADELRRPRRGSRRDGSIPPASRSSASVR